jgi:hypothetical protein
MASGPSGSISEIVHLYRRSDVLHARTQRLGGRVLRVLRRDAERQGSPRSRIMIRDREVLIVWKLDRPGRGPIVQDYSLRSSTCRRLYRRLAQGAERRQAFCLHRRRPGVTRRRLPAGPAVSAGGADGCPTIIRTNVYARIEPHRPTRCGERHATFRSHGRALDGVPVATEPKVRFRKPFQFQPSWMAQPLHASAYSA